MKKVFRFIHAEKVNYPVAVLARVLREYRAMEPNRVWSADIAYPDQGSQFVALAFGQLARADGISQSMGKVGSAYDNSVAETFFATLKKELIYRRSWQTANEIRTEVFEYIEGFYNLRRRHSYLGWVSPAEFEDRACPVLAERPTDTINSSLEKCC